MKFLAPQSRFVLKTFFKRNYDALSDAAQTTTNRVMLVADVAIVYALFFL